MADFKGSILEFNGNKAIVMTGTCDFVTVKRQPDMVIGQEKIFQKSDLYKIRNSYIKYSALVASVILIVFSYFIFSQFLLPGTVFAYIDVDINPSIEITVDKNIQVIEAKPLNEDAKALLKDLKLKKLPLKQAMAELVKECEKQGFIRTDKENAILISASMTEKKTDTALEKTLDVVLADINGGTINIENRKIETEVLRVSPETRDEAVKNNMSMGRYTFYSKIKQEDADLTIDQAKVSKVNDMLKKLHENNKDKDKIQNNTEDVKQNKPEDVKNNSADKDNNKKDKDDKNKEEKNNKEIKQNQGKNNSSGEKNNSPGAKDNSNSNRGEGENENNSGNSKNEKPGKDNTGNNSSNKKELAEKGLLPAELIDKANPFPYLNQIKPAERQANSSADKNNNDNSKHQKDNSNKKNENKEPANEGGKASNSQTDKNKAENNGKNNKK